jgi:hypothetical protein
MQTLDNELQQVDQQAPGGQWNSVQMTGFSGFQMNPQSLTKELISLHSMQDLKDMILMDTGSMLSVFINETFFKDIRPSISMCQMSTNNGSKQLPHEGILPGHHKMVHYDPTSIANIMAFCKVIENPTVHQVVCDSDVEDAFIHKMDSTTIKFKRTSGGLYGLNPKHHILLLIRLTYKDGRLCIRMQPASLFLLSGRIVRVIQHISLTMLRPSGRPIILWVPLLLKILSISSMLKESKTVILLLRMWKLLRRSLALMFLS